MSGKAWIRCHRAMYCRESGPSSGLCGWCQRTIGMRTNWIQYSKCRPLKYHILGIFWFCCRSGCETLQMKLTNNPCKTFSHSNLLVTLPELKNRLIWHKLGCLCQAVMSRMKCLICLMSYRSSADEHCFAARSISNPSFGLHLPTWTWTAASQRHPAHLNLRPIHLLAASTHLNDKTMLVFSASRCHPIHSPQKIATALFHMVFFLQAPRPYINVVSSTVPRFSQKKIVGVKCKWYSDIPHVLVFIAVLRIL